MAALYFFVLLLQFALQWHNEETIYITQVRLLIHTVSCPTTPRPKPGLKVVKPHFNCTASGTIKPPKAHLCLKPHIPFSLPLFWQFHSVLPSYTTTALYLLQTAWQFIIHLAAFWQCLPKAGIWELGCRTPLPESGLCLVKGFSLSHLYI